MSEPKKDFLRRSSPRMPVCWAAVVGAAGLLAPGCGDDETGAQARQLTGLSECQIAKEGYYYLAVAAPLTGPWAGEGIGAVRAATVAVELINGAGAVFGSPVGLVSCDTAAGPTAAADRMRELGGISPLSGTVGPLTSASAAAMLEGANRFTSPLVSGCAAAPTLTTADTGGYFFRTMPSLATEVELAAALMDPTAESPAVLLYRDDPDSSAAAEAGRAALGEASAHLTLGAFDPDADDFAATAAAAVTSVAGARSALIIADATEAAAILRAAVDADVSTEVSWWLTHGALSSELLAELPVAPANLGAVRVLSPSRPTHTRARSMATAYEKAYGRTPHTCDAYVYDATVALGMAMVLAADPDDGADIRDALANQLSAGDTYRDADWSALLTAVGGRGSARREQAPETVDALGITGPIDFDAAGDVRASTDIWTLSGGKLVFERCLSPEAQPCSE